MSPWMAGRLGPATSLSRVTPAAARRCSTSATAPSSTVAGDVLPSAGAPPADDVEKGSDDAADALCLVDDGEHGARGSLVALHPGKQLLGPAGDDPEGRRDLVGDAHGQRPQRGRPARGRELGVAPAAERREGELAFEEQPAPLAAQRGGAEGEDQPGGEEHAQREAPGGAQLPIPDALGARHHGDGPAAEGPSVDAREARRGATRGEPERRGARRNPSDTTCAAGAAANKTKISTLRAEYSARCAHAANSNGHTNCPRRRWTKAAAAPTASRISRYRACALWKFSD